jgi:hypothetical protein
MGTKTAVGNICSFITFGNLTHVHMTFLTEMILNY